MNIILVILSGLLTAFSFPTVFGNVHFPNLGFFAWISLAPLFFVIRNAGPRKSFLYSFAAAAIFYGISLYWLYTALNSYGGLPSYVSIAVLALLIVILAAFIALAPMLAAWLEARTGIARFWTLPVLWVACELARNYGPANGFPWGNITNSQYGYLPVIQIVDIVGIYGLTYVMISFNMAVADCVVKKLSARSGFALALSVFVLVYGYFRIGVIDRQQAMWPSIRVAVMQGNIPQEDKWQAGQEELQFAPYKKFTQTLRNSDVDLIVWSEATYPWPVKVTSDNLQPEILGLGGFKDDSDAVLLMGGLSIEGEKGSSVNERHLYNSMFLLNVGGDILGRYHKVHLVPFGEYVPYKKLLFFAKKLVAPVGDFAAGKYLEPLFTDTFQIAGLVCYEDLFPEIARVLVKKGANFIAVVTNDAWYGRSSAPFQHLAISVFRAVENRRYMVKSANSGVSAVVDATGRVISSTDIFEEGMIVSNAKLGSGSSLYTKFGDWFAYGCLAVAALLLILGTIKRSEVRGRKSDI